MKKIFVFLVIVLLVSPVSGEEVRLPPVSRIHDLGGTPQIVLKYHWRLLPGPGPRFAWTIWEGEQERWRITATWWSPQGPEGMPVKLFFELFSLEVPSGRLISRKEFDYTSEELSLIHI